MEEISEEQQAAMALKLMDNVKQLIIDTVLEGLSGHGALQTRVDALIQNRINETTGGTPMQMAVKRIVMDQMGKY
jgi:hypothetical protein